jgi:hypothetical protein
MSVSPPILMAINIRARSIVLPWRKLTASCAVQEVRGVHIQFTAARYSWSRKRGHVNYDPLVELIHIAEE